MKKICIVTPDCADRPELLKHCQYQVQQQTIKVPHLVISQKPLLKPDLTAKIRLACQVAKERGFEYIAIFENDDYYPNTWLEEIVNTDFDLLGIETTVYYNLIFRQWSLFEHTGRSSLFCTAFKIDALLSFPWPPDDEVYLDVAMWKHFNIQFTPEALTANVKLIEPQNRPIGIKHNIGMVGGIGHTNRDIYENTDPEFDWLWSNMHRADSYKFYTSLAIDIQYKNLNLVKP